MSKITIQGQEFAIDGVITPLHIQALANAIKEKNSYVKYCQDVTQQVDHIEKTFREQYDEIVRDLKRQNKDLTEKNELQGTEIESHQKSTEDLRTRLNQHINSVAELENTISEKQTTLEEQNSKITELELQLDHLSTDADDSVNLEFFKIYDEKVTQVISAVTEASQSIQNIQEEIQRMNQQRLEVFERIKSTTVVMDEPGVTDLRHEKSEVQDFQKLLSEMGEKTLLMRELPAKINQMIVEINQLWSTSENPILQNFGTKQHELLQTIVRWKMELEPKVYL